MRIQNNASFRTSLKPIPEEKSPKPSLDPIPEHGRVTPREAEKKTSLDSIPEHGKVIPPEGKRGKPSRISGMDRLQMATIEKGARNIAEANNAMTAQEKRAAFTTPLPERGTPEFHARLEIRGNLLAGGYVPEGDRRGVFQQNPNPPVHPRWTTEELQSPKRSASLPGTVASDARPSKLAGKSPEHLARVQQGAQEILRKNETFRREIAISGPPALPKRGTPEFDAQIEARLNLMAENPKEYHDLFYGPQRTGATNPATQGNAAAPGPGPTTPPGRGPAEHDAASLSFRLPGHSAHAGQPRPHAAGPGNSDFSRLSPYRMEGGEIYPASDPEPQRIPLDSPPERAPHARPEPGGTLDMMDSTDSLSSRKSETGHLTYLLKNPSENRSELLRLEAQLEQPPLDRTRTWGGRPGYDLGFKDEHLHQPARLVQPHVPSAPVIPSRQGAGSDSPSDLGASSQMPGAESGPFGSANPNRSRNLALGAAAGLGVAGLGLMAMGGSSGSKEAEAGSAGARSQA